MGLTRGSHPPPKAQPAPGNAQAKGPRRDTGISGKPAGVPHACRTDEVRDAFQRPESLRSRDRGGSSALARSLVHDPVRSGPVIENALPDDPTPKPLKTVPLDAWHRAFGARMVEFAGYSMPVQYQGVLAEHLHCRCTRGTVRCVAHGPGNVSGPAAAAALEQLVPGDIVGTEAWAAALHAADERGGRDPRRPDGASLAGDRLFVVVNASRKDIDFTHIAANLPSGVQLQLHDDRALLALQGPAAAAVIGRILPEAAQLPFMGVASRSRSPAFHVSCPARATPARTASRFPSRPRQREELGAAAACDEPEVRPSRPRRTRFAAARGRASACMATTSTN